jgi:hypothetical protein
MWASSSAAVPGMVGGTMVYVVTQVRDATLTPPLIWTPTTAPFGDLYGISEEFTFTLGTSAIAYPSMTGSAGSWAAGSFSLDQYGTGEKGAIALKGPPGPPQFCCGPKSQAVVIGSTVGLSVLSGPVVAYQWQFNGSDIPGASSSSLSLTNVQPTNAGNYRVFGTNSYGFGVSSNGVLQVLPTNAPSIKIDDEFAVGTVVVVAPATISIDGGFTNGFIFYTVDGTAPSSSSTLYTGSFTLTNSATIQAMSLSADFSQSATAPPVSLVIIPTYTLQTSVSGSGTVNPSSGIFASNSVVTLTANPDPEWAFDHWEGDLTGNANPTSLTMSGPRSVLAVFAVAAYPISVTSPGAGTVTLNGQTNPPQMFFSTNSIVTLAAFPSNGWTFLAWQGTVSSTDNPFTLAMTQSNYVVGVFGTTVATNIGGSGTVSFSPPNPIPFGTLLTATAVPAPGFKFVTWSQALAGTNNPAAFTVLNPSPTVGALFVGSPTAPIITQQPHSQIVLVGSNATFTVGANGSPPLSYQWRKGGVPVGGASLPSYSITTASTNDNGAYDVIVFNSYGSATSTVATLTVVVPVSISVQPSNQTVASGTSVTFGVAAQGSDPLFYQWAKGTNAIAGATNSSITLNSVTTNDSGYYSVIVSNLYSATTSAVAALTVYIPVEITSEPTTQVVSAGSTASFSVGATGFPAPAYQWYFESYVIPAAMDSSLVLTNIGTNRLGTYSAVAYNAYSSATSTPAVLFMSPSIRTPFLGATVIWGKSATLSVGAIGSGTLTYQWFRNGVAIPQGTNSVLTFSSVQLSDGGLYSVVISSAYGSITNVAAQVIVNPANISLGVYAGITVDGVAGYTYGIDYTTDLTDTNSWIRLTNLTLTSPVETWVDLGVDVRSTKARYYRVTAE